nr:hypothetical protein [Tanacetum cinerariifolium]
MASIFGSKSKSFVTMSIPSQGEPLINRPVNDPRDFAKPVKAISLPQDVPSTSDSRLIELKNQFQHLMEAHLSPKQPVQVNKITSSREIYSGPHDTQYCIENPKQAYVDYASSHKHMESFELGKNRSAFIQGEMPKRMEDPGLFTLPCKLEDSKPFDTLADLGSCVNIIPLYLFKKLNIGLLEETDHVFRLADGTKSYPIGIVKDVGVHIGRLKLLSGFYIIDMKKDPKTPLLVGRGFLATANAVIYFKKAKISVGEGITRSVFRVKGIELGKEEASSWTTVGKIEPYKPRPSSDGVGARTLYDAKKEFIDFHLSSKWEIARDAKINPFKDVLVFRRMVKFLGAIPINLKRNMWDEKAKAVEEPKEQNVSPIRSGRGKDMSKKSANETDDADGSNIDLTDDNLVRDDDVAWYGEYFQQHSNLGWFTKKSRSANAMRRTTWFDLLLKSSIDLNEDHILGSSTMAIAKKLKEIIQKDELTITYLEGAGPEKLKLHYKNSVKLEYNVDQLKVAVVSEAQWNNDKGDVSKPRSFECHMSKSSKPHPSFYNNDLYYLVYLSTKEKYTTSLTKHYAKRKNDNNGNRKNNWSNNGNNVNKENYDSLPLRARMGSFPNRTLKPSHSFEWRKTVFEMVTCMGIRYAKAPNHLQEGSKTERNIEGNRPSKVRAEENERREMNLLSLLAARLGRSENGQTLQSSLTSVHEGRQSSINIGRNLPLNNMLLSHHVQPFIPSSVHVPNGFVHTHVDPYSQPSVSTINGQTLSFSFQAQTGNPSVERTSVYPPQRGYPFHTQPMYAQPNMPMCLSPYPAGLFANPTGSVTPFVRWIEDYPLLDGRKMPSHAGSYNGNGDPDNFLHLFEGAIRMQKWLMPVACHMFTYTLKDSARICWISQKAGSILNYEDLKAKFRSHFSQQKRFTKTHLAVYSIKQREGESVRAFATRYTDDTLQILSLHEDRCISGFVYGLRTRNLVEHLSTDLPSTYKGLMEKTYTWIEAREVLLIEPQMIRWITSKGQRNPHGTTPGDIKAETGSSLTEDLIRDCSLAYLKVCHEKSSKDFRITSTVAHKIPQIPIAKKDEENMAFYIREGVLCYKRFPFGLKNMGETYQRLIDKVFSCQVGRNMEVNADEIVIKSNSKEEMLVDIKETLGRLRVINLKLNPKKRSFRVEEGRFSGHLITKQRIKADPSKVKVISDLQSPKSVSKIQNLDKKLATIEADEAFRRMKELLEALSTVSAPVNGKTLIVSLAASKESTSAVLMAERGKKQVPMYFASQTLYGAELEYPKLEKLILALEQHRSITSSKRYTKDHESARGITIDSIEDHKAGILLAINALGCKGINLKM